MEREAAELEAVGGASLPSYKATCHVRLALDLSRLLLITKSMRTSKDVSVCACQVCGQIAVLSRQDICL